MRSSRTNSNRSLLASVGLRRSSAGSRSKATIRDEEPEPDMARTDPTRLLMEAIQTEPEEASEQAEQDADADLALPEDDEVSPDFADIGADDVEQADTTDNNHHSAETSLDNSGDDMEGSGPASPIGLSVIQEQETQPVPKTVSHPALSHAVNSCQHRNGCVCNRQLALPLACPTTAPSDGSVS